jgi:hypothetical protein
MPQFLVYRLEELMMSQKLVAGFVNSTYASERSGWANDIS